MEHDIETIIIGVVIMVVGYIGFALMAALLEIKEEYEHEDSKDKL